MQWGLLVLAAMTPFIADAEMQTLNAGLYDKDADAAGRHAGRVLLSAAPAFLPFTRTYGAKLGDWTLKSGMEVASRFTRYDTDVLVGPRRHCEQPHARELFDTVAQARKQSFACPMTSRGSDVNRCPDLSRSCFQPATSSDEPSRTDRPTCA